jgi:hypothetical protein
MNPEEQEAFRSMAKVGLTLYRGLIDDGANSEEAFFVLAALFAGMVVASKTQGENN